MFYYLHFFNCELMHFVNPKRPCGFIFDEIDTMFAFSEQIRHNSFQKTYIWWLLLSSNLVNDAIEWISVYYVSANQNIFPLTEIY